MAAGGGDHGFLGKLGGLFDGLVIGDSGVVSPFANKGGSNCSSGEQGCRGAVGAVSPQFNSAFHKFSIGGDDNEEGGAARGSGDGIHFRTRLPAPMTVSHDVSAWSVLKQCIGKDLSKVTMPVVFNEPLTFLQRMAEYLEYAPLLVRAAESADPIERLELVTAFAVSATSSNWERTGKPFNPLLAETYELDCTAELGYRLVCEQVSHHPPVSALHAEAPSLYVLHASILPKLKFWGKSLEVTPKGTVTLHLLKHDEVYTWQNVSCFVNNVIVGKLWLEHCGSLEVLNQRTKHKAVLTFKQNDALGKDLHKVEGYILDPSEHKLRALYGKWVEALYSSGVDVWETYIKSTRRSLSPSVLSFAKAKSSDEVPSRGSSCDLHIPGQKLLWEAAARPEHSSECFSFSQFALGLNELHAKTCSNLPPTDSRLRPDLRLFEQGDLEGAQTEKNRVEEKQRLAKKERKRNKEEHKPRWFALTTNSYSGKEDWQFTGEYWQRDWSRSPNIF